MVEGFKFFFVTQQIHSGKKVWLEISELVTSVSGKVIFVLLNLNERKAEP
jgi:hypothetical protein